MRISESCCARIITKPRKEVVKMNNYVIAFDINGNMFNNPVQIEGKNPKEALKDYFGKEYKYVTGREPKSFDIILLKGALENGSFKADGRRRMLYYKETRG